MSYERRGGREGGKCCFCYLWFLLLCGVVELKKELERGWEDGRISMLFCFVLDVRGLAAYVFRGWDFYGGSDEKYVECRGHGRYCLGGCELCVVVMGVLVSISVLLVIEMGCMWVCVSYRED